MTTYVEVASELVSAGYLSAADVDAAAALLADALMVSDAEVAIDTARQDEAYREDAIADAAGLAEDDAWAGDFEDKAYQEERVWDAKTQVAFHEETIAKARARIAAACGDAAAALAGAELIDTANVDGGIAVTEKALVAETD
jgi:hypothetical protein